jgi:ABC-type lipoprotein release transport system permease subunit
MAGPVAGIVGAFAPARALQYGVRLSHMVSLLAAMLFLSAAVLAACLIPVWQAAQDDPIRALNVQ